MIDTPTNSSLAGVTRLREQVVKAALATLDWPPLRSHLDEITTDKLELSALCGYILRCSDLICKYPRQVFEQRRTDFLEHLRVYVSSRLDSESADQVTQVSEMILQIEHGYRRILDALATFEAGHVPAEVRASGSISHACEVYRDLIGVRDRMMAESTELNLISGLRLQNDSGHAIPLDAVLEGLSEAVAMTLIMEAHKNNWFVDNIVVTPRLPAVDESIRDQSGLTQTLALCWRQWQRLDKRLRFLNGRLALYRDEHLPSGLPDEIQTLITHIPNEDSLLKRETYDYLANSRLKDRLIQTYVEMEIEKGLSGIGVGIAGGAALPPDQFVSTAEAHAVASLSEALGFPIVIDGERPAGLRLIEWVRGYIVLKEIAEMRTHDQGASGDVYAIRLEKVELIGFLHACGVQGDAADCFIELASLHGSARDMFDCPLVCMGTSSYLLFAPAVLNLNVPMAILSNLSNRGAVIGRKGSSFESVVRATFLKHNMSVFTFRFYSGGEEYEYDALVPWDNYLFVFECKNRSLSGNDPAQVYYFDLEVAAQARQVRRLADALMRHTEVIEQKMGPQYVGCNIIPVVLHSLPYARADDVDGVYFTDWSALTRFFDQPYLRIKVPHRVGNATILHRTAIRKLWKGDAPTADDFLEQLRNPVQLELSLKHLDVNLLQFSISESDLVVTPELVRTAMTTRSISEAMGADADKVLQEIAAIRDRIEKMRVALERHEEGMPKS